MAQSNVHLPPPPVVAGDTTPVLSIAGQQIAVFTKPMEMMQSLIRDVQAAKSRIWLEDFIVSNDWAGEQLGEALRERAAAGLDVRLMYDPIGSIATSASFFDSLRDSGAQVHAFHHPGRSLLKLQFRKLNIRNHRRLFIVDDQIGYFGGMNIGDFGGPGSKRPQSCHQSATSATWPDFHVRLLGPRQAELAACYDALWQRVHRGRSSHRPIWQLDTLLHPPAEEVISFFDSDPRGSGRSPEQVLVPLLRRARRSITLLIAYFIPLGRVYRALLAAARRGVKVRLVVPADSDVKIVEYATRHIYRKLIRRGIEIYERTGQMLHAKAVIVDSQLAMIGSSNIDPRSLRMNLEFFAVIRSRALCELLERLAAEEISESTRITRQWIAHRSWWQRTLSAFFWRFRRWL